MRKAIAIAAALLAGCATKQSGESTACPDFTK